MAPKKNKLDVVEQEEAESDGDEAVVDMRKLPAWKRYYMKCANLFKKPKPAPKRIWRKEKEADSDDDDDDDDTTEDDSDAQSGDDDLEARKRKTALEKQEAQEALEELKSVRVQCLVRRFLARVHRRHRLQAAVEAAEAAAGTLTQEYASRKKAKLGLRAARVAHEQFTRCYVADLLGGTSMFIIQTIAITSIQKNWRGHKVRKRVFLVWKKEHAPPKKFVSKYVPTIARRVWARKEFVPDGGWPAMKWAVIEYDIHEHIERPPKGRDFGLKTRKVLLPAKLPRNKDIIIKDVNAWVGIPVNIEPLSVINQRAIHRKQELALLEGVSPYVGPQFKAIDIKPPAPLEGIAAIRALGWTPKMIDRRPPPPSGKRAYKVIDAYSNAALAADLATVAMPGQVYDDVSTSTGQVSTSSRHDAFPSLPLGSSLEHQSISSFFNKDTFAGHTQKSKNSESTRLGVGMGVWTGGADNHVAIPVPGEYQQRKQYQSSLLTHKTASVVQLITPIRGSVKPLSSKHVASLKQANLLPDDLEEDYALQQIREAGGKDVGNGQKARERRRRRAEKAAEMVAMHDPSKWAQTIGGRLRLQAADLANEMRTQREPLQKVDDDPWSRSTYIPPREFPSKVLVWPKQPKQSYKIKYSWIPQTMVKDAAVQVYADIRKEQGKGMREDTRNFPKSLKKKPKPKM